MKYANVDGEKREAFQGGKGLCDCCNQETVAKCGTQKIHHWAHKSLKHCDDWWEPETEWHRQWKSFFPKEWQEVVHFDLKTGEKHIADIKTESGIVIEFQNSPMDIPEMESREKFYQKMVWVINALGFANRFHILGKLPNPKSNFAKDIRFFPQKIKWQGRVFFRISENPYYNNDNEFGMVEIHSISDIEAEIEENYIGHHFFDWEKPREVWYNAVCDVLFDFGGKVLWKLVNMYDDRGLKCVKAIDKQYFIERALASKSK
ncbi:MAG: hypothetical protein GC192_01345 [Bacteroidetes bacterium]|nr:hypothetical protein [Bacteroidota bacterium]